MALKEGLRKKKVICFDLDGTLIDANKAHVLAFNMAFKVNNLPILPAERITPRFGIAAELLIKELFPKISDRKLPRCVEDHTRFTIEKTAKYAKAIKGANSVLKWLKQYCKLALISNCTHEEIQALLKASGIDGHIFDIILGKNDIKHPKPSPDEIHKVEQILGTKVACIVGDTVYDIRAGKAAGVKTIAVLSGSGTLKQLIEEDPTAIIESVALLPKVIKVKK